MPINRRLELLLLSILKLVGEYLCRWLREHGRHQGRR